MTCPACKNGMVRNWRTVLVEGEFFIVWYWWCYSCGHERGLEDD